MGIWETEVIRVDGKLFAYVRIQNDFSGNVSGTFRRIYQNKRGQYYYKADGHNQIIHEPVKLFLAREIKKKEIMIFIISIKIR